MDTATIIWIIVIIVVVIIIILLLSSFSTPSQVILLPGRTSTPTGGTLPSTGGVPSTGPVAGVTSTPVVRHVDEFGSGVSYAPSSEISYAPGLASGTCPYAPLSSVYRSDPAGEALARMRTLWVEHYLLFRQWMIDRRDGSVSESSARKSLEDVDSTIVNNFASFYGNDAARYRELAGNHTRLEMDIVNAMLSSKQSGDIAALVRQWHNNEDNMARFFSGINRYIDYQRMSQILRAHVDAELHDIEAVINRNYAESVLTQAEAVRRAEDAARCLAVGTAKLVDGNPDTSTM